MELYKKLYKKSEVFNFKSYFVNKKISWYKNVLDVWFFWQWIDKDDKNWPHDLIRNNNKNVFWIDINKKINLLNKNKYFYELKDAEKFNYKNKFDIIYAWDLIEHLSNPGLFIESCIKSIKKGWRIYITTPNCFWFFNIMEKIFKNEPAVNNEHICYFNLKTFNQFIIRYGLEINNIYFIKYLKKDRRESILKKIQNFIYSFIKLFTNKFMETIVFELVKK